MAEKPNKWSREEGFFAANSADIFTGAIVLLCGVVFILLAVTQWNMGGLVDKYFQDQAAAQPPPPPRQPDIASKPGETGMMLFPAKPAENKKNP